MRKSSLKVMAKYVPIEMVKEYHGKICEHSDVYFAKKGKTLYTGKMCNPRNLETNPYDADELARQAKFAQAAAAVKALTSEQKAAYKAEWLKQDKYQFLSAFIMHKEFAKLV